MKRLRSMRNRFSALIRYRPGAPGEGQHVQEPTLGGRDADLRHARVHQRLRNARERGVLRREQRADVPIHVREDRVQADP